MIKGSYSCSFVRSDAREVGIESMLCLFSLLRLCLLTLLCLLESKECWFSKLRTSNCMYNGCTDIIWFNLKPSNNCFSWSNSGWILTRMRINCNYLRKIEIIKISLRFRRYKVTILLAFQAFVPRWHLFAFLVLCILSWFVRLFFQT